MRSTPPQLISTLDPNRSLHIAEHSMCHPGLPNPHGDCHSGSPSFIPFVNSLLLLPFQYCLDDNDDGDDYDKNIEEISIVNDINNNKLIV